MDNVSQSWIEMVDGMSKADMLEENSMSPYEEQTQIWDAFVEWCDALLKQRDRFEWLKEEGFDLVLTDDPDLCSVGLAHYLGIPRHIWFSTGPLHEINSRLLGIPPMLSYVPVLESRQLVGPVMTFSDRVKNMYSYAVGTIVQWRHVQKVTALYRKHISPTFPDVGKLASTAALCFVNSDQFIDIARPVLHKTVYIGGVGITQPKPLSAEIEKAMSKGKKGVVYVSFGSFAPTTYMSTKKKSELFKAFAELSDHHFIVKISRDDGTSRDMVVGSANIELIEWFPQIDAL
ncbi:CBN-UGT-49 protein, partial [Aphelenchoides avenae]